jgi:CRP-like cAMP-binding protein
VEKSFYILGHLSDDNMEWIAANGVHRVAVAGEVIIRLNEPSDSIFFLLSGEMVVTIKDAEEIARLKKVDIIGEMSLVDRSSLPSATVTASEESVLLEIPKIAIMNKLTEDRDFAANFYHAVSIFLAERLRSHYLVAASKKR